MGIYATQRWSGLKMERSGNGWTGTRMFDVLFTNELATGGTNDLWSGSPATMIATPAKALTQVYTTFSVQQNVAYGSGSDSNGAGAQYMYCQGVSTQNRGLGVYEVTAFYSSTPEGRFMVAGDPLSEPIEYAWSPGNLSAQVDRDIFGNPLCNANGDVFEELPSQNFTARNLTVRLNIAGPAAPGGTDIRINDGDVWSDTVNSDVWKLGPYGNWTFVKGQARCVSIHPITPITIFSPYVRMEYNFEIRNAISSAVDGDGLCDAWKYRVANTGQRCFYTNGGVTSLALIIYKGGGELNQAQDVRLAEDGTPIQTASFAVNGIGSSTPVANPHLLSGLTDPPVIDTSTSNIVFLMYQLYPVKTFNDLDF